MANATHSAGVPAGETAVAGSEFPTAGSPTQTSAPKVVRYALPVTAIIGVTIGSFWLMAWALGIAARWSATGVITVKTNMALGQFLAGAALLLVGLPRAGSARRWAGAVAAIIVLLLGTLTLGEHLFHYNLGIDQLLASEPAGAVATSSPNRMGLPGSSSLLLLGAGLLALAARRRFIAPYLGLTVCLINLLPAVGFLYGVDQFYRLPRTGIAWPSVVALMSLGIGLVLAHSDGGPMLMLLRDDPGAVLLRRLLPALLLIPLALGFLSVQGQHRAVYGTAFGTGMLVIAMVLLFSIWLWRSAAVLSHSAAEQAKAQQAVLKSKDRLEMFIKRAPAGLAMFDREMRYVAVSDRWLQDTGFREGDILGRCHYDVFPELPTHWKEAHRRGMAGESLKDEEDWTALDGKEHSIRWEIHPWGDSGKETGGIIIFMEDITDRKHAEAALRESEDRFRAVYQNASVGIEQVAVDGRLLMVNAALCRMLNYSESELLSRTLEEITHADDRSAEQVLLAELYRGERNSYEIDKRYLRSDGSPLWVHVNSSLVKSRNGRPDFRISVVSDVGERRQAEEAMMMAEKIAVSARMAAVLAHEINNPIMAVGNLVYLLQNDSSLSESSKTLLGLAEQELSRVSQITQRALNVSRAKAALEPVRISAALDDLLQLYSKNIQRAALTVERRYDFREEMLLDGSAIRQVLTNLLVNAVEAVPAGGKIRLHVYASPDWRDMKRRGVRIVIADNGPGISVENRSKLFQPFFTTKGSSGTGLGLWVTRGIIGKMGGSLRLHSSTRPGRSGACFAVFLPFGKI